MDSPSNPDPGRSFIFSGPAAGPPSPTQQPPHSPAGRLTSTATRLPGSGSRATAAAPRSPSDAAELTRSSPRVVLNSVDRLQHDTVRPGQEASAVAVSADSGRWGQSLRNVEDAQADMDRLARSIEDAIYLDEDSYNQLAPQSAFMRAIQAQQSRVQQLEGEVQRLLVKADLSEAACLAAEQLAEDKNAELENNSIVFKLHFDELIRKDEEIQRLKNVIQGMS